MEKGFLGCDDARRLDGVVLWRRSDEDNENT
jgi:hypothetical protein